ncbi:unnamed protein product [Pleuronectes platessa]|uniref:C2H2-type domain-containing protein n=1 Tax=Pleuronectes platessa TaxID=8262 RepID=A0A9N7U8R4_PLEPL|nr:unnamed protein product [Pleuronectes platessa]
MESNPQPHKRFICSFPACSAAYNKQWKLDAHMCKHAGRLREVLLHPAPPAAAPAQPQRGPALPLPGARLLPGLHHQLQPHQAHEPRAQPGAEDLPVQVRGLRARVQEEQAAEVPRV